MSILVGLLFGLQHKATGLYLGTTDQFDGAEVGLSTHELAPVWRFRDHQNGRYLLIHPETTLCLNVAYERKAIGAALELWSCNGGASEMWKVVSTSRGGITLVNQNSGLVLGATGSTPGSAVIQMANSNDPLAQWQVNIPDHFASSLLHGNGITSPVATNFHAATFGDEMIYNIYTPIFSSSGNLVAIIHDLPRIASLGFSTILLMPIHPIGVPHGGHPACESPYAVADHTAVNAALGTLFDFACLISEAHALGLKIIMDVVLNHTAWNHPWIVEEPQFYVHTDYIRSNPNSISQAFHFADVAQLDFKSQTAVTRYMVQKLVWWMQKFAVDGFRFDTADNPYGRDRMIPAESWHFIGIHLKSVNPRVILLGECCNPELSLSPFNMDYTNYSLQPAVVFAIKAQDASDLPKVSIQLRSAHPEGMLHTSIMQTWDMDLDLKMYGGPDGTLCAAVFNFTIEGVPMLFAGEEVGNDRGGYNTHVPVNWGSPLADRFSSFYKSLGMLRRNHEALRRGATEWLVVLASGAAAGLIAFTRKGQSEEFLIAINFSISHVKGSACRGNSLFRKEKISTGGWSEVTPPGAAHAKPHPNPPAIKLGPWDFTIFCRAI